jgi:hypothetical protein
MTISSVGGGSVTPPTLKTQVAPTVKPADGDHRVAGSGTSKVKDADGDYKVLSPAALAAANSSTGVQAALNALRKGG